MRRACAKCGVEKGLEDFSGKRALCRECRKAYNAEYRAGNLERIKEQQCEYRKANRDGKKSYNAEYHAKNRERQNARSRSYRQSLSEDDRSRVLESARSYSERHYKANKERIKKTQSAYYAANSERVRERQAAYQRNNLGKVRSTRKLYRDANPEKIKALSADWTRRNIAWVTAKTRARFILKKTAARLGDIEETKKQEAQMRRENPGMHIDHIVPITPPLVMSLGERPIGHRSRLHGPRIPLVYGFHHPSNWQILTPAENIRKSNRDWPDSPWS